MSPELARIQELEQTVEDLVAYLRRLPLNPETYNQAKNGEAVLNKPPSSGTLQGAKFAPAGIAYLGVKLEGRTVTVLTQDVAGMPSNYQRDHKLSLFNSLVHGIRVELSMKQIDGWENFFGPRLTEDREQREDYFSLARGSLKVILGALRGDIAHQGYCFRADSNDDWELLERQLPDNETPLCPICHAVFEIEHSMRKQKQFSRYSGSYGLLDADADRSE